MCVFPSQNSGSEYNNPSVGEISEHDNFLREDPECSNGHEHAEPEDFNVDISETNWTSFWNCFQEVWIYWYITKLIEPTDPFEIMIVLHRLLVISYNRIPNINYTTRPYIDDVVVCPKKTFLTGHLDSLYQSDGESMAKIKLKSGILTTKTHKKINYNLANMWRTNGICLRF